MTSSEAVESDGSQPTVDALATGLRSVEIGRRVGWAKAFDALRRVESLEAEVHDLREMHKQLQRAYSRLIGLMDGLGLTDPGGVIQREMSAHRDAERTFRRKDAREEGERLAELALQQWDERKIKTQALHDFRVQLAEAVAKEAKPLGHIADTVWVEGASDLAGKNLWQATCLCGWTSPVRGRQQAGEFERDHLTEVVYGITAKQLDKNRADERNVFVQKAVASWRREQAAAEEEIA